MDKKDFIVMDEDEMKHYIKIHKEHELNRTSTDDRNAFWKKYSQEKS